METVHIIAQSIDGVSCYPNEVQEGASFFYLHGLLEDKNHYDICTFMKGTKPSEAGIYPVKVHHVDGSIEDARLFCYKDHMFNKLRGLVVSVHDTLEMQLRAKCFYNAEGDEEICEELYDAMT